MPLFQGGDLDLLGLFYTTSGGTLESWHGASVTSGATTNTAAAAIDTLWTVPLFIGGRARTLDRIGFEVTTGGGAGSVARVGIYQATSPTDFYPSALIVDGGEIITTVAAGTGVKAATVSVTLRPNILYWVVYLAGVDAPTVRNIPVSGRMPMLTSALLVRGALSVAQAYGALPDPYTAGAGHSATAQPIVAIRLSA